MALYTQENKQHLETKLPELKLREDRRKAEISALISEVELIIQTYPENENVAPLYHNEEILGLVIDKVNELTE
jgi:hypothetical protein